MQEIAHSHTLNTTFALSLCPGLYMYLRLNYFLLCSHLLLLILCRSSLALLAPSHHALCVVSPSPAPQTQPCLRQWRRYSSGPDQSGNQSFVMNTFLGKMETAELLPFPEGVIQRNHCGSQDCIVLLY
jgi:hypothetical protein